MYSFLLSFHSIFRWFVVLGLLFLVLYSWYKKSNDSVFTSCDFSFVKTINIIFSIQVLIGIFLYFHSTMAMYFIHHLREGVHIRDIRFFGLEHPFMMLLSAFLSNYFTYCCRKKVGSHKGFYFVFIGFFVVFLLIFISIPWGFSPFTSRPYFRFF